MQVITPQSLATALAAAVRAYGPDYIDPQAATPGGCSYRYDDNGPDGNYRTCIVGWVARWHGQTIPFTVGLSVCDLFGCGTADGDEFVLQISDASVALALKGAQQQQDGGSTWGEAAIYALRLLWDADFAAEQRNLNTLDAGPLDNAPRKYVRHKYGL